MGRGKGSKKKNAGVPKKPPLTHFLCIPLVTPSSRPQLESSIEKFKRDLYADISSGGIMDDEFPSRPSFPKDEDKEGEPRQQVDSNE